MPDKKAVVILGAGIGDRQALTQGGRAGPQ